MPQGRGYLRFGDWHPGPSPNRKFMIPTTKEQSHEQRTQRGSIRPPSARLTEAFTQRSSTTPGRVPATVARRAQTLETASRASVFTAPAYKRTTGSNARPTAWEACKVPALSVFTWDSLAAAGLSCCGVRRIGNTRGNRRQGRRAPTGLSALMRPRRTHRDQQIVHVAV